MQWNMDCMFWQKRRKIRKASNILSHCFLRHKDVMMTVSYFDNMTNCIRWLKKSKEKVQNIRKSCHWICNNVVSFFATATQILRTSWWALGIREKLEEVTKSSSRRTPFHLPYDLITYTSYLLRVFFVTSVDVMFLFVLQDTLFFLLSIVLFSRDDGLCLHCKNKELFLSQVLSWHNIPRTSSLT